MLALFTTVRSYSYAKGIKEKRKKKSNKWKSPSIWREIKNPPLAKISVIEYFIIASCSLRQWLETYDKTAIFIVTYFKKHVFEALYLNFELPTAEFWIRLLWPTGFRCCLGAQSGLGAQPCYKPPGNLWVEIVETQWPTPGKQGWPLDNSHPNLDMGQPNSRYV